MKKAPDPTTAPTLPRRRSLLLGLLSTPLLAACGGGIGEVASIVATVGSGGTGAPLSGSSTFGSITGFGSVIVNGVRFDSSAARITLDDGPAQENDLRLGMTIEIDGVKNADGVTGSAAAIVAASFVEGPAAGIDAPANVLTVLGVRIIVTPETAYDGFANLMSLSVNDFVEIHGLANGVDGLRATRIQKKAGGNSLRLTGAVQNLTGNSFMIGAFTVRYTSADLSGMPSGLSNGMLVRVKGSLLDSTSMSAERIRSAGLVPVLAEGIQLSVEGLASAFKGPGNFELNGTTVQIQSGAAVENGPVTANAWVEVEGIATGNVLVAQKVKVKNYIQEPEERNEVTGAITSVDPVNRKFTVRNGTVNVRWDDNTRFDNLSASTLGPATRIEVKGKLRGNELLATKIKLDK